MITKKETTVIYEKKNGEYKEQVILYDKALIRCLKELRKKIARMIAGEEEKEEIF